MEKLDIKIEHDLSFHSFLNLSDIIANITETKMVEYIIVANVPFHDNRGTEWQICMIYWLEKNEFSTHERVKLDKGGNLLLGHYYSKIADVLQDYLKRVELQFTLGYAKKGRV